MKKVKKALKTLKLQKCKKTCIFEHFLQKNDFFVYKPRRQNRIFNTFYAKITLFLQNFYFLNEKILTNVCVFT